MKDIPINEVSDAEYVVSNDDDHNFEKIIHSYNIYNDKYVIKLWVSTYFCLDDEKEEFD